MRILTFGLLLIGLAATAQIDVSVEPVIPAFLEEIVGDGTEISNIQLNGVDFATPHERAGVFVDPQMTMGFLSGIILSSGLVESAEGPNESTGTSNPSATVDYYEDLELEGLSPHNLSDIVVLEFDFVPIGDTLYMDYVFASEEYPEYNCTTVNDLVGIFLTGPAPGGDDYDLTNIALVPEPSGEGFTETIVSINSVNDGTALGNDLSSCEELDPDFADYSVFYVENITDFYEFDGRTTVLPLRTPLVSGEMYHIKIGIGDATDSMFDSAILIGDDGFKTTTANPNSLADLADLNIVIGPNPSNGILQLDVKDDTLNSANVVIRDLSGKIVHSTPLQLGQGVLDVQFLEPGVYLVELLEGANVKAQTRIVLQ